MKTLSLTLKEWTALLACAVMLSTTVLAQDSFIDRQTARAEMGDSDAQVILGYVYWQGSHSVAQNYVESAKWFRKAADQGEATAQHFLGVLYFNGQGVPQDLAEALKWQLKAAEQGLVDAQYTVGCAYLIGQGVAKDDSEALKWVRKAADAGHLDAQKTLSVFSYQGVGRPKDLVEGLKWNKRAAHQGLSEAQASLGVNYLKGEIVPKDYVESYKWLSLAAAQGDTAAGATRDGLAKLEMTREQVAEGQRRAAAFVPRKEADSWINGKLPDKQTAGSSKTNKGSGSSFFITENGFLLTKFHVVNNADHIVVKTRQGNFRATFVKGDWANDLAVLKATGTFDALSLSSSRTVKLGNSVFTIGFPNVDLQGFSPKLTKGLINSLSGASDDPRKFQFSVLVQPGNSGGPLINEFGNVVGVVVGKATALEFLDSTGDLPENVSYVVKSSYALSFLESVPEVAGQLKEPHQEKPRLFDEVVKEAEAAAALVLVY